ncbi:MAG: hypothetical protein COA78_10835 [Blastopirellula sp.]|nr:MAG: hypothetical protein COA78_10835 [Blastopirellula sp.]
MKKELVADLLLVLLLIVVGSLLRIVFIGYPNVAPTAAFALFAGARLKHPMLALLVPLSICVFSDLYIGGYSLFVTAAVYFSLCLPVLLGMLYRQVKSTQSSWRAPAGNLAWLTGGTLLGATLFFLITNGAVWYSSDIAMYSGSFSGLMQCYAVALPFFRFTLMGDLGFAFATFGTYALVFRLIGVKQANAEPVVAS